MLVTGGRYRHRSRGTARLCARQKRSATPTWCHHVLGVNPSADHSGRRVGTTANACHDPFVLFGFLSGCTQQICTATDYPSGEASGLTRTVVGWSFQLRIGVGWNEVEF